MLYVVVAIPQTKCGNSPALPYCTYGGLVSFTSRGAILKAKA